MTPSWVTWRRRSASRRRCSTPGSPASPGPSRGGRGSRASTRACSTRRPRGRVLPTAMYTIGLGMVIPTMIEFGTDEQKERYVAKALRGEEVWSQLFSEPGAGSDVASLQMRGRARRRGVGAQRAEGVDHRRPDLRLRRRHRPHERRRPEAPGHHHVRRRLQGAGRRGAAAAPDDRRRQLQRGVLQRRPRPDRQRHRTGRRRVALRHRHADERAGGDRLPAGRAVAAATAAGIEPYLKLARARASTRTRSCAKGWPTCTSASGCSASSGQRTRAAVKAGKAPGPEGSVAKLAGALLTRRTSDLAIAIAGAAGQAWDADDPKGERWASAVLMAPGRPHRRRHRRGAAEHRRRARARASRRSRRSIASCRSRSSRSARSATTDRFVNGL